MTQSPTPDHEPSGIGAERDASLREQLSDKRVLGLIGVALVAVVALAAFVVVPALSSKGSSDTASEPIAAAAPSRAASGTSSASPSSLPTEQQQITVRNPFLPLASASAVDAAATSLAATSAASIAVPTPVVTAPTTVATQQPVPASSASNIAFTELALVHLTPAAGTSPETADVTVNGLPYTVKLKQSFASGFVVTALTATSATFTYQGRTTTLAPGEFALYGATS